MISSARDRSYCGSMTCGPSSQWSLLHRSAALVSLGVGLAHLTAPSAGGGAGTRGRYAMRRQLSPDSARVFSTLAIVSLFCVWLGCDRAKDQQSAASRTSSSGSSTKVKVGYIGLTCEAPLFTAYEKGFFKEEGVDVEMVKSDWAGFK